MTSSCSICAKLKKQTKPVTWCSECAESFCQPCEDHHRVSESSKDHTTIPYTDYEQLPSIILSTKTKCSEHQERFTDFCRDHDQVICKSCLKSSHRKCRDIPSINEIVHNVKTSVLFEDVMSDVENACKTFSNAAENRKANIKALEDTRKNMHTKLNEMFDKIIKQLYKVKENTVAKIDKVIGHHQNIIADVLRTVEANEQMFNNILTQQEKIKMYASNVQTFLGLKQIEESVFESHQALRKLSADNKLDDTNISIETYGVIDEIVGSIQSFGDVKVGKIPSNVQIDTGKAQEAQKEVHRAAEIQLLPQKKFELDPEGRYYGCCISPNGVIIIPDDKGRKLYIYDFEGSQKSTINCKNKKGVFDVTPIDDHRLAISYPQSKEIAIVNLEDNKTEKIISTEQNPYGISHENGVIFFCVQRTGIYKLWLSSEKVDVVVRDRDVELFSHISVGYDRICYTRPKTFSVIVLDGECRAVFQFKDEALLKEPWGIAVDQDRNVYVTGFFTTQNLVTISPDGKTCRKLLGKENKLLNPTAVHFDPKTRSILIVNQFGPAWRYSVN